MTSTLIQSCESEERDFHWQERVYNRNEIMFYSNPNNCVTGESKRIHEYVKDLEPGSQKWLFSFSELPSEDYRSMVEKSIFADNFQVKKGVCQRQKNEGIIQRKAYGRNIVDYYPTKVVNTAAPIVGNEQTMYILADLNNNSMSQENIVLISCIKWDPLKKTLQIFPDFRSPNTFETGYSVVLDEDPQFSLEYWVYQELVENGKVPLLQVPQYPEIPVRDNFVMPRQGYLEVHFFVNIKKAFGFECNKLFINYIIEIPNGWTVSNDSKVRGVTTTAEQQHGESVFSHLLEVKLTLELDNLQHNSGSTKWPEILLEVKSMDHWGHSRVEGYGSLRMPIYPGCYTAEVPTWRPALSSACDKLHYFFTGISPQLMDPLYSGASNTAEVKKVPYLSKYGFISAASGKVMVECNIVHHLKPFTRKTSINKGTEYILEKLTASTLLNSVNSVVKAFKEAHRRMLNASESV